MRNLEPPDISILAGISPTPFPALRGFPAPMLERTAAGLESCTLQRVLARPARSAGRRHRNLHTGFWQHGASAIELSSLWPQFPRASDIYPADVVSPIQPSFVASAFLLDFLYPSGARELLRQLSPFVTRPRDVRKPSRRSVEARFSSSFPPNHVVAKDSSDAQTSAQAVTDGEQIPEQPQPLGEDEMEAGRLRDLAADSVGVSTAIEPAENQDTVMSSQEQQPLPSTGAGLAELLSKPNEERYTDVWNSYVLLDDQMRKSFRPRVAIYLSESRSSLEVRRVYTLLGDMPVQDWDNGSLAALVLTLIRLGNVTAAMDKFMLGMESRGLVGGLDHLLTEAVETKQWKAMLTTWLAYYEFCKQEGGEVGINISSMDCLSDVRDLGHLYISFELYLATDGAEDEVDIQTSSISAKGLRSLRRRFATRALEQPCHPAQAAIILKSHRSTRLYHEYLFRMIARWRAKQESKSDLALLKPIYQTFRQIPGARPHVGLLRGMFDTYYPDDHTGIEQLYGDWIHYHGSLDSRGYEQFLKYYAKLGQIEKVQRLWTHWITSVPDALEQPGAFRSILNVYAQVGDPDALERQIHFLSTQFGFKPDTVCWNMLLKSYVKAEDFEKALQLFETIRHEGTPNSFTYTHALTVAAKQGDLQTALALINVAQEEAIPFSGEMAFTLVWMYCQRDELAAAERVCIELTERGRAGTKAWNTLLHYYGMRGRLAKCYTLFEAMRARAVPWDSETFEFLLQAMVRRGQVQPAYDFLRRTHEQGLFALRPEHFTAVVSRPWLLRPSLIQALKALMEKTAVLPTFAMRVAELQAAQTHKLHSAYARSLRIGLVDSLRELLSAEAVSEDEGSASLTPTPKVFADVRGWKRQNQSIGRAVMLLIAARDFDTAENFVAAYMELSQNHDVEYFDFNVISALMEGLLNMGAYKDVHALWEKAWSRALILGQLPGENGIRPSHEYALCRMVTIMIENFKAQEDGVGLLECIKQLESKGFKLTSRPWNAVIQELSRMGLWEAAMEWCERLLMPQWKGWHRTQVRARGRYMIRNQRLLQPTRKVVLTLQAEWLRRREFGAWSSDIARQLDEVPSRFPRLHRAFTMSGTTVRPKLLREGQVVLKKSLDRWFKKMSPQQKRALHDQLGKSWRLMTLAEAKGGFPVSQNWSPEQKEFLFDLVQEELADEDTTTGYPSTNSEGISDESRSLSRTDPESHVADGDQRSFVPEPSKRRRDVEFPGRFQQKNTGLSSDATAVPTEARR